MQLTQQIKIKPTVEQEIVLKELSEKCRLIYNFALEERKEAFKKGVKGINYIKQQNDLPKIKKKYPEYNWVYSKVLQYTLRVLDANYKSFFTLWKKGDRTARLPGYKGKKYFTTLVYNQYGFKYKKGYIEFSHKYPIKTRLLFNIPSKFSFDKIYQIAIVKRDNKFYLSVTYEKLEKKYSDNNLYQAFDLGVIKHTGINMMGKSIDLINKRPDKYWESKIQKIQSRKDHCKQNSRKWQLLNKNMIRMKRKSSNQLKDFQHKLSRKVINNTRANTIVLGKLETKKLSHKNKYAKGLHRSLHNTGNISRFIRFLTYKARIAGKRIIEINERGTTKTCCICGNKQEMPLYKRKYACDCGNYIDRDKNSAINIMYNFLSQNALWTGYFQFVSNLRQTDLTMVRYSQ